VGRGALDDMGATAAGLASDSGWPSTIMVLLRQGRQHTQYMPPSRASNAPTETPTAIGIRVPMLLLDDDDDGEVDWAVDTVMMEKVAEVILAVSTVVDPTAVPS